MNSKVTAFNAYKTDKREEIISFNRLINDSEMALSRKDKRLLISSYIVLSYAYWESCFHKFQELVFTKYQKEMVKNLPFKIRNAVYIELAKKAANQSCNKKICEVKSANVFDTIQKKMHDLDDISLENTIYKDKFSHIFISSTQNPRLNQFKELLNRYNFDFDEIIKNVDINPVFEEGLKFIIEQRNSIAHKNEQIQFNDKTFLNYDECYSEFKSLNSCSMTTISDFLTEMNFEIDKFFTYFSKVIILGAQS